MVERRGRAGGPVRVRASVSHSKHKLMKLKRKQQQTHKNAINTKEITIKLKAQRERPTRLSSLPCHCSSVAWHAIRMEMNFEALAACVGRFPQFPSFSAWEFQVAGYRDAPLALASPRAALPSHFFGDGVRDF